MINNFGQKTETQQRQNKQANMQIFARAGN